MVRRSQFELLELNHEKCRFSNVCICYLSWQKAALTLSQTHTFFIENICHVCTLTLSSPPQCTSLCCKQCQDTEITTKNEIFRWGTTRTFICFSWVFIIALQQKVNTILSDLTFVLWERLHHFENYTLGCNFFTCLIGKRYKEVSKAEICTQHARAMARLVTGHLIH